MEDGQGNSEHDFISLQEDEVPQSLQDLEVEVVCEEAGEPLQRGHARLIEASLEVGRKSRKLLCDELFYDLLINSSAHHLLEVIHRHQSFYDTCERPEDLLLRHHLQESSYNEVEPLAVADVSVTNAVDGAHSRDGLEHFLPELLLQRRLSLAIFSCFEE